ncbi:gliding motility protein GldM [Leeuwenhoekiella sp. W20_SRS_FM14]|uniref:type IX secretion system motor protein PorM/GldM n=1 Tax=Leeuwenhoekiella sp. W20_SRS_FM14 TaxID=3240270 RepID=UPI003F98B091
MAGGKQSPRQKMINLMYLVFIAMLALNMSKEVLSAFGLLNDKINEANITSDMRNQAFLAGLAEKASEQPAKYGPIQAKAQKVNSLASDLDGYIANLKAEMIAKLEDPTDYETQDKTDFLDQRFFQGDKLSKEGEEFKAKVENFRNEIVALTEESYPAIASEVKQKFNTDEVANRDGKKIEWLSYNFEGFPLIASRTKLTQMQADIKTTQSELLSSMLAGEQAAQLSMKNYQAIVIPDKSAFFSNENFKGKVVLGRYDNTLSFDKVVINGKEVSQASGGQVTLDFPAGGVGERKITGELQFKEGDSVVTIPINDSYAVINKPNSATISADKMNVVYRGVANPMTISFAGVPDNSVNASAPGLSKQSGSNYIMNPGSGNEVTINVSGTMADGSKVSDSKKFRIKDIPSPTGTLRGEDGILKMQRNALEISTVGAKLMDFDFDLNLNVTGFKFNVPGQPTVQVSGSKLDSRAKDVLRRAQRGSTVQIFDITAQISGNSSYRLKKVAPVLIELTN